MCEMELNLSGYCHAEITAWMGIAIAIFIHMMRVATVTFLIYIAIDIDILANYKRVSNIIFLAIST